MKHWGSKYNALSFERKMIGLVLETTFTSFETLCALRSVCRQEQPRLANENHCQSVYAGGTGIHRNLD